MNVLKWPVIKQVVSTAKGVKKIVSILGFITGQRTQKLLVVLGLIVAIAQPLVKSNFPEYEFVVIKIMEILGVSAGITFADKINRLIEAIKDAAKG